MTVFSQSSTFPFHHFLLSPSFHSSMSLTVLDLRLRIPSCSIIPRPPAFHSYMSSRTRPTLKPQPSHSSSLHVLLILRICEFSTSSYLYDSFLSILHLPIPPFPPISIFPFFHVPYSLRP